MKKIGLLIAALAHSTPPRLPTGVGRERKGDARRLPESQRAKNAGVEGAIVHYGDDVGYSALFIGGRYPQPFMKTSRAGSCAYISAPRRRRRCRRWRGLDRLQEIVQETHDD